MPMTMIYSETDRVVSAQMSRNVLAQLGARESDEDVYDTRGVLECKGKAAPLIYHKIPLNHAIDYAFNDLHRSAQ